MFSKRNLESGVEEPGSRELVRLAIPRLVYTQSHVDYMIEVVEASVPAPGALEAVPLSGTSAVSQALHRPIQKWSNAPKNEGWNRCLGLDTSWQIKNQWRFIIFGDIL